MMKDLMIQFVFHPLTLVLKYLSIFIVFAFLRRIYIRFLKKRRVTVVVLGDVGRSPRMQYHAASLAQNGFDVDLVGFSGSKVSAFVENSDGLTIHYTKEAVVKGLPRIITYCLKVLLQSVYLLKTLLVDVGAAHFIMIQNPPCIPGLAICFFVSVLNGSHLVIDWHNYGYTILSMALGRKHILVKIAKFYEEVFGQLASTNICVTEALKNDLDNNWKISATVMHDRPGPLFKPIDLKEQFHLYNKLSESYSEFQSLDNSSGNRFINIDDDGGLQMRKDRPAIIISSTSWTEDEDFSILIDMLDLYEKDITENLPDILCVVTGKGPLKSYYKEILSTKSWKHIQVVTPWLEAEDYPKLLASSDVGVSLHTSSSGLDLPMKVVDMFGSQLPVLAISFPCLEELVKHESNGLVFHDKEEFKEQLCLVLSDFYDEQSLLKKFRTNIDKFRENDWQKSWMEKVHPCFKL